MLLLGLTSSDSLYPHVVEKGEVVTSADRITTTKWPMFEGWVSQHMMCWGREVCLGYSLIFICWGAIISNLVKYICLILDKVSPLCSKLKSFIGLVALFCLVQSPNFFNIPSRLDSPVDTLNNIAKQKQSNVEKLFSFNDIFSNYLGKAQVPI